MALATLAFTIMIGLVKIARDEMSAIDVVFWRGVLSIVFAAAIAYPVGFRVTNKPVLALRAVLGLGAMLCYYTAAKELPLADLTLIGKVRPILIAAAAPVVLGLTERSGGRLWLALSVGLIGCVLLLQPGLHMGSAAGMWALGGAVFSGAAHLTLRVLGRTDNPRTVVFWFQGSVCIGPLLWTLATTGNVVPTPPPHLWLHMVGIAALATAGQLLLTLAYKADKASRVAGAAYLGPLYAVIGDVLLFDGWPSPMVIVGGLLVTGTGLALIAGQRTDRYGDCHSSSIV